MSKYKLTYDQFKDNWINKPNNMGDVGDLQDITDELNNLLHERDEVREAFKIVYNERVQMELERNEWKNKAYSHATDYTLMEAKCFRLEQQLKEYDQLKS